MDAFYGEIRLFAFGFQPQGWMLCDGRTLPMQNYQALFAVIGFTYGGDNQTHFNIPNLQGRVAVAAGDDPLDAFDPQVAAFGGETGVTLTTNQVPPHTHTFTGAVAAGTVRVAAAQGNWLSGPVLLSSSGNKSSSAFAPEPASGTVTLAPGTVAPYNGLGQAHENRQPFLALGYYICYEGAAFPVRN
ncbi:tail fiber protein [Azospirillum sp. SYSU D00513]|uniref:phage tail protein n=1 Tax=Azospirillum sp. SYSU D00513 TaxID=2812561 RepID=UPI001A958C89|nr:tail fiber protein [Azospirillum sp. SYSU D00513]